MQLAVYQRGTQRCSALKERKGIESERDSGLRGEACVRLPILVKTKQNKRIPVYVLIRLLCSKHIATTDKILRKPKLYS